MFFLTVTHEIQITVIADIGVTLGCSGNAQQRHHTHLTHKEKVKSKKSALMTVFPVEEF